MVDSEISILIKAVDDVSVTMKNIEANLDKSNKNIQAQTQATTKTFQDQTGNLLILGQTANSVDRIFDSYQNMQLRLENSTERVNSASDRLRDAQYKLTKVQKDTTASAEDLKKAQQDVESSSRSLTIAQNRLKITQNQVIGTYIGMGMQGVTLVASFKKVKTAIVEMTTASWAFIASPLGVVLVVLATTIGSVTAAIYLNKKAMEDVKVAQENLTISTQAYEDALAMVADKTNEILDASKKAYDEMLGLVNTKSTQEIQAEIDIYNQKKKVAEAEKNNINTQRLSGDAWEYEKIKAQEAYNTEKGILSSMQADFTSRYEVDKEGLRLTLELEKAKATESSGIQKTANDFWKLTIEEQLLYIKETFNILMIQYAKELADAEIAESARARDQKIADIQAVSDAQTKQEFIKKIITIPKKITETFLPKSFKTIKDAIISPQGDIITTDPADYLIATKDPSSLGGGMTIIIQGDNYGVNADAIAEQLMNKLKRRISV